MREVLPDLLRYWRAGESVGMGTVIATFKSAPRPPGASMLVGPGGEAVGSVSGGCVEGAVYDRGQSVLTDGQPVLQRYGAVTGERACWGLTRDLWETMAKTKPKSSSKTKPEANAKSSEKTSVDKTKTTANRDKRIKELERRLEEAVAAAESAAKQTQKAAKQMSKQRKVVAAMPHRVARDVHPSAAAASEKSPRKTAAVKQAKTSPARMLTKVASKSAPKPTGKSAAKKSVLKTAPSTQKSAPSTSAKKATPTARKTTNKPTAKPATPAPSAAATSASTTSSSGDLESMTRQDLLVLARSRDLTGRNAMTKAELVAKLS